MEDWERQRDQMEREFTRQQAVDGCINVFVGVAWVVMLFVMVFAGSR